MEPPGYVSAKSFLSGCSAIYVIDVAAGVPGIVPGGLSCALRCHFGLQSCHSGWHDAVLHGSQEGYHHARKRALDIHPAVGGAFL
jgi:hypothetical protein